MLGIVLDPRKAKNNQDIIPNLKNYLRTQNKQL